MPFVLLFALNAYHSTKQVYSLSVKPIRILDGRGWLRPTKLLNTQPESVQEIGQVR